MLHAYIKQVHLLYTRMYLPIKKPSNKSLTLYKAIEATLILAEFEISRQQE